MDPKICTISEAENLTRPGTGPNKTGVLVSDVNITFSGNKGNRKVTANKKRKPDLLYVKLFPIICSGETVKKRREGKESSVWFCVLLWSPVINLARAEDGWMRGATAESSAIVSSVPTLLISAGNMEPGLRGMDEGGPHWYKVVFPIFFKNL